MTRSTQNGHPRGSPLPSTVQTGRKQEAKVRSKAETLQLIVMILLAPLRVTELRPPSHLQPREGDPLWQIGHAAFDACRALVSAFDDEDETAVRFADHFHGKRNREPWNGERPELFAVLEWWNEILSKAERTLANRSLTESLPDPVKFTAYTVHSLHEAYDYVLYHTSFHLGVAQGMIDRG